jgi:hypothetical protein
MTTQVIPESERRNLRYDFSAVETHDMSLRLANKVKELDSVKEEAKSVAAQWSAKTGVISAEIKKPSNSVADGWEFREIECTVAYNKPKAGRKTYTRKDNSATFEEAMEDWEWNLFTQVDAENTVQDRLEGEKPKRKGKKAEEMYNSPDDISEIL